MAIKEKRIIRIEDHEGNIYIPEGFGVIGGSDNSNVGNSILNNVTSSDQYEKVTEYKLGNITEGVIVSTDDTSTGTIISIQDNTNKDSIIANRVYKNPIYGKYSLSMRIKMQLSADLMKLRKLLVKIYYVNDINNTTDQGELLSTITLLLYSIKSTNENKFNEIYFTFDFCPKKHSRNSGMLVSIIAPQITQTETPVRNVTYNFDWLSLAKSNTAVTGSYINIVNTDANNV